MVDHVVPWHVGGATDIGNLVACCSRCNRLKYGDTDIIEDLLEARNPDDVEMILKAFSDEWRDQEDYALLNAYENRLRELADPE